MIKPSFSCTMGAETLDELVRNSLSLHSDKLAVIEDYGSSKCSMTYKDLWDTSCAVSEALAKIGKSCSERRSQFIAVCMDQCLIYPAVILGILHQGFGFACVDPSWTNEKLDDYLRRLGTLLLIHNNKERMCNSKVQQCRVKVRDTTLYFEKYSSERCLRECPHRMAYAVLTSGSTGQPKIVRVPHSSIVPNIIDIMKICNITSRDTVFLSSPSTFDPSVVDIFVAFSSGASLLVTSKSVKASSGTLLQVLFPEDGSQGISVLQMTPSVFNRWSEKELRDVVLNSRTSLRVLIFGGEPFPSQSKLIRCKGIRNATHIYNIYGITEVSPWASIHQVIPPLTDPHIVHSQHGEDPIPLGLPLSDTLFEVRDCSTGCAIDIGYGEMFIGSSTRTCEVDDESCLDYCSPLYRSTGDIVQIHSDGKIYYVGRKDHTVKRWGHRINLENVERIALSHASVKCACCIWDEERHKLFLIVSLRETLPLLALRRHFLTSIGSENALVPDEILPVEDLSLTLHGKVNRQSVLSFLDRKPPPLQLLVKELFMKLWCEVLGLQSASEEESFLHFGGNSLLAVILMTELEDNLGEVPKNFGSLLLAGESFSFICEQLCQFHRDRLSQTNVILPLPLVKERNPQSGTTCALEVETKDAQNGKDKLKCYSLRGRISNENIPSITIPRSSLGQIKINLSWKIDLGKCIDASPLFLLYESGHQGIIIGSHSGKVAYVDGTTGEPRWLIILPNRIESSACPSACGQYVFLGCYDGFLYCINTLSGKIKWSFKTKAEIKCPPVLCNEGTSVIFGSYDKHVYCISSEFGVLEWSSTLSEAEDGKGNWLAAPLVIGKIAILCNLARTVTAVQTIDGKVIWTIALAHPSFSTPCHFSGSCGTFVVIAEVRGSIHCFNVLTGERVWTWEAAGFIFAPLTIVPNSPENDRCPFQILVGCYDFFLYCLSVDAENEVSLQWKTKLGARLGSAPFPFNIKTTSGTSNICATICNAIGEAFIINLQDGRIHGFYNVKSEVFSSSVVYNDKMYFGSRDNNMYSLRMQFQD